MTKIDLGIAIGAGIGTSLTQKGDKKNNNKP